MEQTTKSQVGTYTETPSTQIHGTLSSLFKDGDTIIVSCTRLHSDTMHKAVFTTIYETADYATVLDRDLEVTNIYINLQQLKPGVQNDRRTDVQAYVRFLVDIGRLDKKLHVEGCNPKTCKCPKVNASEEERIELRKVADEVNRWVSGILEAHPLVADSGNGFHLCWALKPSAFEKLIPPSHDNQTIYEEALLAIKQRFDNDIVEIDASLIEPEQLIRLWGTWNRRNPETEGRTHRQSRIIERPRGTVTMSSLLVLSSEYKAPAKTLNKKGDAPLLHPDFDEAAWWEHYSSIFGCEGERDGWQITSICPATYEGRDTGRRHTGSKVTGFRFDRGMAEYHCFSDDHCNMTFGQVMKQVHQYFPKYKGKVWDFPEDDGFDWAEYFDDDIVQETKSQAVPLKLEPEKDSKKFDIVRTDTGGMIGIRASDVVERPVDWLWKGRLPLGSGLIISGPVACNKSTAALAFVACVTTGKDWPDGEKNTMGPREVLIAATEDDPETTIKPRLMAAGADCTKVIFLTNMFDMDDSGRRKSRPLRLQEDSRRLYDALVAHPEILMVVLDPLTGFFGDVDGNDNKKIRPMMQNIAKVCQMTRTAVVMIIHENKRSDTNAVDKILGSGAVSQVVRAGLRFSRDPKNKPNGRIMANIKGNLSKSNGGMRFSVESADIMSSSGVLLEEIAYIKWGETHEMSADDVMDEARALKKEDGDDVDGKLGVAVKIFSDALAGGKRLHRDVHALLDSAGVKDETKRRAKWKLGVVSSKSSPWYWWLPGTVVEETKPQVQDAKLADVDVM